MNIYCHMREILQRVAACGMPSQTPCASHCKQWIIHRNQKKRLTCMGLYLFCWMRIPRLSTQRVVFIAYDTRTELLISLIFFS